MAERHDNVLFILRALAGSEDPLTAADLAAEHPAYNAFQIYAIMSGMGARAQVWWIRPDGLWTRDARFHITSEGLQEMRRRATYGPRKRRRSQKKSRQSRACPCCNRPYGEKR